MPGLQTRDSPDRLSPPFARSSHSHIPCFKPHGEVALNARYGPGKVALPEQRQGTIVHNGADAKKQLVSQRRENAAEDAAGDG